MAGKPANKPLSGSVDFPVGFLRAGWIAVLVASLVAPWAVQARIEKVPHSLEEMKFEKGLIHENVRVATTRVVMADYDLIARDFPAQARHEHESVAAWKSRVDQWLVNETGFIAVQQTEQTLVNTPIPLGTGMKKSVRPNGYKRAHVLPVEGGVMDAKGIGALSPAQKHHGNGLASLGEMVREFIYEKLVASIFADAKVNARTVGCYAVLDYGFDIVNADGSKMRAGYVLRQPHIRAKGPNSSLDPTRALEIERTLRRYGLTGSGETFAYRSQGHQVAFDYLNIQGTNNLETAEILDFGAFLAVDHFDQDITDGLGTVYVKKNAPDFVQPDPSLRVRLEEWGNLGKADPKFDNPWRYSHELATAWAEGRASRSAFESHFEAMVRTSTKRLSSEVQCIGLFQTTVDGP